MVETDPRPPPYNAELPREFCLEYWIGPIGLQLIDDVRRETLSGEVVLTPSLNEHSNRTSHDSNKSTLFRDIQFCVGI